MLRARASEVRGPVATIVDTFRGNFRDLAADQLQTRLCGESLLDEAGKGVPVDGERLSGRDGRGIGRRHDQGIHPPHLLLEEADGIVQGVGAERIAADELGKKRRFVGGREAVGLHLAEPHPVIRAGGAARPPRSRPARRR